VITPVELTGTSIEFFALDDIAASLRQEDAYERSGRTAASLARGDDLTMTLTVARAGTTIREHDAPGPVIIVSLEGRIVLETTDGKRTLEPGGATAFAADVRHGVQAREDSAFLVIIGGRAESRRRGPGGS